MHTRGTVDEIRDPSRHRNGLSREPVALKGKCAVDARRRCGEATRERCDRAFIVSISLMLLQPPGGEHRCQCEADEERKERRDGNGQAELPEQASDVAVHECNWGKHHNVEKRDGDSRQSNLRPPSQGGDHRGLSEPEVSMNVFQNHDAVIDEDSDQQCESKKAHQVEGEPNEVHHQKGADQRRWDCQ